MATFDKLTADKNMIMLEAMKRFSMQDNPRDYQNLPGNLVGEDQQHQIFSQQTQIYQNQENQYMNQGAGTKGRQKVGAMAVPNSFGVKPSNQTTGRLRSQQNNQAPTGGVNISSQISNSYNTQTNNVASNRHINAQCQKKGVLYEQNSRSTSSNGRKQKTSLSTKDNQLINIQQNPTIDYTNAISHTDENQYDQHQPTPQNLLMQNLNPFYNTAAAAASQKMFNNPQNYGSSEYLGAQIKNQLNVKYCTEQSKENTQQTLSMISQMQPQYHQMQQKGVSQQPPKGKKRSSSKSVVTKRSRSGSKSSCNGRRKVHSQKAKSVSSKSKEQKYKIPTGAQYKKIDFEIAEKIIAMAENTKLSKIAYNEAVKEFQDEKNRTNSDLMSDNISSNLARTCHSRQRQNLKLDFTDIVKAYEIVMTKLGINTAEGETHYYNLMVKISLLLKEKSKISSWRQALRYQIKMTAAEQKVKNHRHTETKRKAFCMWLVKFLQSKQKLHSHKLSQTQPQCSDLKNQSAKFNIHLNNNNLTGLISNELDQNQKDLQFQYLHNFNSFYNKQILREDCNHHYQLAFPTKNIFSQSKAGHNGFNNQRDSTSPLNPQSNLNLQQQHQILSNNASNYENLMQSFLDNVTSPISQTENNNLLTNYLIKQKMLMSQNNHVYQDKVKNNNNKIGVRGEDNIIVNKDLKLGTQSSSTKIQVLPLQPQGLKTNKSQDIINASSEKYGTQIDVKNKIKQYNNGFIMTDPAAMTLQINSPQKQLNANDYINAPSETLHNQNQIYDSARHSQQTHLNQIYKQLISKVPASQHSHHSNRSSNQSQSTRACFILQRLTDKLIMKTPLSTYMGVEHDKQQTYMLRLCVQKWALSNYFGKIKDEIYKHCGRPRKGTLKLQGSSFEKRRKSNTSSNSVNRKRSSSVNRNHGVSTTNQSLKSSVHNSSTYQEQVQLLENYRRDKTMRQCLAALQEYGFQKKRLKECAFEVCEGVNFRLLQQSLQRWVTNYNESVTLRENLQEAEYFNKSRKLILVFKYLRAHYQGQKEVRVRGTQNLAYLQAVFNMVEVRSKENLRNQNLMPMNFSSKFQQFSAQILSIDNKIIRDKHVAFTLNQFDRQVKQRIFRQFKLEYYKLKYFKLQRNSRTQNMVMNILAIHCVKSQEHTYRILKVQALQRMNNLRKIVGAMKVYSERQRFLKRVGQVVARKHQKGLKIKYLNHMLQKTLFQIECKKNHQLSKEQYQYILVTKVIRALFLYKEEQQYKQTLNRQVMLQINRSKKEKYFQAFRKMTQKLKSLSKHKEEFTFQRDYTDKSEHFQEWHDYAMKQRRARIFNEHQIATRFMQVLRTGTLKSKISGQMEAIAYHMRFRNLKKAFIQTLRECVLTVKLKRVIRRENYEQVQKNRLQKLFQGFILYKEYRIFMKEQTLMAVSCGDKLYKRTVFKALYRHAHIQKSLRVLNLKSSFSFKKNSFHQLKFACHKQRILDEHSAYFSNKLQHKLMLNLITDWKVKAIKRGTTKAMLKSKVLYFQKVRSLRRLRNYSRQQQICMRKFNQIQGLSANNLIQMVFRGWKKYAQSHEQRQKRMALMFYKKRIMAQAFKRLYKKYTLGSLSKRIAQDNLRNEKRVFFNIWISGLLKNRVQVQSVVYMQRRRKLKMVRKWRQIAQESNEVREMQTISDHFYFNKILKPKALRAFQISMQAKEEKNQLNQFVMNWNQAYRKKQILTKFTQYVDMRQNKRQVNAQWEDKVSYMIKKRYFKSLQGYTTLLRQNQKIDTTMRHKVMQRVFNNIRFASIALKKKRLDRVKGLIFSNKQVMRRLFNMLKQNTEDSVIEKQKSLLACAQYGKNVKAKYFDAFVAFLQKQIYLKKMQKEYLNHKKTQKAQYFYRIIQKTIEEPKLLEQGDAFYLKKCFKRFQKGIRHKICPSYTENELKVFKHISLQLQQKAFMSLKIYQKFRRIKLQRYYHAHVYQLEKFFSRWQDHYVDRNKYNYLNIHQIVANRNRQDAFSRKETLISKSQNFNVSKPYILPQSPFFIHRIH